jgi:membrane associated rhomboid family serine protease
MNLGELKWPSFATSATIVFCVAIYALQLLGFVSTNSFCIGPLRWLGAAPLDLLIDSHRVTTSNFLHGSPTHLLFNMLTLYGLGDEFERRIGSARFLHWLLVLASLGGLLDAVLCTALVDIPWLPFFRSCSIGLSGFLFSLMIEQTSRMDAARSVPLFCGTFNVPVRFYPWALLLVLALFPGVSFVGHLAGILVGLLYARGFLGWLEINQQAIDKIDSILRNRIKNYVVVGGGGLPLTR